MRAELMLTNVRGVRQRLGALFSAAVMAAVAIVSAGGASGQAHLPLTERSGTFPDGQRWQITVPANYNGTLINDLDRIGSTSRANVILPQGYAYTGTARHPDRGTNWNPRAESDNNAKVVDMFEAEFGRPVRAIQFGCSGGGSVALSVAEDHPTRFDGVIPMEATSPVTLANQRLDVTFALKALLDPNNTLPLVVSDATAAAGEQLWINLLNAAQQTPQGRARMGLAVVLAQYPVWGSNNNPQAPRPNQSDPAAVQAGLVRVAVDAARIAITSRPQWDNPAGFMSWNTGVDYVQFWANADPNHKQIVQTMYAQAGLNVGNDLNAINGTPRLAGTNQSVNYWRERTHTGKPGVPMLQIHDIGDARTPVSNTASYDNSVRLFGGTARNLLYRQAFLDIPGHCTFNNADLAAAIETMIRRIDSGKWDNLASPDAMNALGLGFGTPRYARPSVPLGYTPPKTVNRAFYPNSPGVPNP